MNNIYNSNPDILSLQGQCNTLSNVSLTCPSETVMKGALTSFTVNWTGGQGPFTVGIYEQGDALPFIYWQPVTNGGTIIGLINLPEGTHTIYAVVADLCNTQSAQSYSSSPICTLNVLPTCTPNYQCRTPLDGYETDLNNCSGSVDRLNSLCNPVAMQQQCPSGQMNVPFVGCTSQTYVIAGAVGIGIVVLMMLK